MQRRRWRRHQRGPRLAAGMPISTRFEGDQRLDGRPQFVIPQWPGHDRASLHDRNHGKPCAILSEVLIDP
jgi:hypothetical protein